MSRFPIDRMEDLIDDSPIARIAATARREMLALIAAVKAERAALFVSGVQTGLALAIGEQHSTEKT